jgi:2'-hydroxyisoflavone reductase
MDLLILGGTQFLGRHLAGQALARGHAVTLFHRGRTNAGLFPEAMHVLGDRDGGLAALDKQRWDAVIDTCGYVPRLVRASAERLRDAAGRYVFISSISVYADFSRDGPDEDAPLATLADVNTEAINGETYGGLKALCEQAVREVMGRERCLIARPGLIVGPHDPTGRFTWWVQRVARGGELLCPATPERRVQFIDVRDLAAWLLDQAERGGAGTFNLTGPAEPLTMGAFIDTARATLNPDANAHWVSEAFLLEQGVTPWTELPLWVPQDSVGIHAANIERALHAGLRCRALGETLRDTWAWAAQDAAASSPPGTAAMRSPVGLSVERETQLLTRWRDSLSLPGRGQG